jgi:predicted nucleotidyltransferase
LFTQQPITDELVGDVTRKIVEAFRPRRIIAFGSYARGAQQPDSDLDLIVEMESEKPFYERGLGIAALFRNRKWALDLLVYTPDEFATLKQVFGTLPYRVEREGKVLYERP